MQSTMHIRLYCSFKPSMWWSDVLSLRWELSFLLIVKPNHYFWSVIQIVLVHALLWIVKLFVIFSIGIYVFLVLYIGSEGIVDSLASGVRHCSVVGVKFTSKVTNCTSILFLSDCSHLHTSVACSSLWIFQGSRSHCAIMELTIFELVSNTII